MLKQQVGRPSSTRQPPNTTTTAFPCASHPSIHHALKTVGHSKHQFTSKRHSAIVQSTALRTAPVTLSEDTLTAPKWLSPPEDAMSSRLVRVSFSLHLKTKMGEGVKLIGSDPKMGSWSLDKAIELSYAPGDNWTVTVELEPGSIYEYKYAVIDFNTKQAIAWQEGANSILAIGEENAVAVKDNWGNAPGASVEVNGQVLTREEKLQQWVTSVKGEATRLRRELGFVAQSLENIATICDPLDTPKTSAQSYRW